MQNHYWIVERWTQIRGWHFLDAQYTRKAARDVARRSSAPTRIRKYIPA